MAEIAERLGETRQNLSSLLSKDDVRTGLIERLAAATGIPLLEFYGQPAATENHITGDGNMVNNGHDQTTADPGLVSVIQEQQCQMSRLITVIENLTKQ